MIIVKFRGGLGNQMYCYNLYDYIRTKYPGVVVKADIGEYTYNNVAHFGFEMTKLYPCLDIAYASKNEILHAGGFYDRNRSGIIDIGFKFVWNHILNTASIARKRGKIQESSVKSLMDLDRIIEKSICDNTDILLDGQWTDFKYAVSEWYLDLSEIIGKLDCCNKSLYEKMKNGESISVHVRRGDYLTYGIKTPDLTWYKEAILRAAEKFDNPVIYLFSDDKEYLETAFSYLDNAVIVGNNTGENSFYDMVLMSACKHNVICNSTFSVWAAKMNTFEGKMVLYPTRFFEHNQLDKSEGWRGI